MKNKRLLKLLKMYGADKNTETWELPGLVLLYGPARNDASERHHVVKILNDILRKIKEEKGD